jgi:tryptophan-rich sensory protein
MSRALGTALWVAASLAAGGIGSIASRDAPAFYARLDTPAWAPPSWLFGPVWTTLYILMGIAAAIVWRERGWGGARGALTLFVAQLALNALWSWIFFAWRMGGPALAEILLLLALVVATMVAFARVRRTAAALLVPYVLWVAYATALTVSLWRRNPGLL